MLRVLIIASACFVAGPALRADEPLRIPAGQRQLFLDDHVIESIQKLTRTMHTPEKRGAVLRPDVDADGSRVEVFGTVPMWSPQDGHFKLVYMAFPMENHSEIGAALAVSKDGIHWEKPELNQNVTVRGSTKNNRIFVERELRWGDNSLMNVVYDPDDPDPQRRYKGLLGAIGRVPVVSGDAIHWKQLPVEKIPSSDTSTLTYDARQRRYLAVLKTFNKYGRAAAISFSDDFVKWSKPRPCFSADDVDQKMALEIVRERVNDRRFERPLFVDPEPAADFKPPPGHIPTWRAECYAFSVIPYEGLYLGLPMMYYPTGQELPARNNTDGFNIIQLAMSRDLTDWKRLGDRQPFIGPSPIDHGLVGVYDRQELLPPSELVVQGDELWFYYTGFKTRIPPYTQNSDGTPRDQSKLTAAERADLDDGWSAICLAALRRDGFVSLGAGDESGTLRTRPLVVDGTSLHVNVDAAGGAMDVSVLDDKGETIAVAETVSGDRVREKLRWKSGEISKIRGKPFSLQFSLHSSRLYSFWCE